MAEAAIGIVSLGIQLEQTSAGTPKTNVTINDCIEACRVSIEQLDKKLLKVQSVADPGKLTTKTHDQGRRLLYPFRESTLVKLKEIVTDIRSNLALAVDTTHLQTPLNISGQVRDLAAFIIDRDRDLESREIINWLSPLRFYECQVDTLSQREDGTGEWIFASPEFQDWMSGSRKTLWCWGQPGAGKTVLASSIIDRLETRHLSSTDALTFIYCSYKDRFSQTLVALVSSLVQQIVRCCASIPEPVRALYSQHQSRNTRPTVSEYSIILRDLVTIFPRTYLIIDALDECQESDETRSKFTKLLLDLPTNVHLLCTSRKLGDISDSFSSAARLEIAGSNSDIELFLTGQISGNRRLRSFCETSLDLKRTILDKVISNAKGMFLLAKLHIQSLKTKTSSRQVKKALERLPAELSTVYHDAIQRIRGQHEEEAQLAMRLLSWITHSYRPLKVEELQHAMAVMDFEPDDKSISEEDLPAESMIITVCGGLAVVDPRSQIVRLVHYTTEEYFDMYRENLFPDARVEIARSCIRYLSMDVFSQRGCRTYDDMKRQREKFKLLKYASINWGKHASGSVEFEVKDEIIALLKDGALLSTLTHTVYNPKDDITGLGLLIAARFGLGATFAAILASGVDINVRGRRQQTALHEAISNGHEHMVRLLLKSGADIEAKDDNGSTPFITAASIGHENIIRLFLNGRTLSTSYKVYAVDFDFETALHKAVQHGSESMVSLLLCHGAKTSARNIRGETPLFLAVESGSLGIVKLLLERGAQVDAWNVIRRTPLWNAVMYGDEALIQILCDHGADTEVESDDGRSPLHVALEGAQWRIVKLLLTARAKVPLDITTAVHMAAKSGYLEGVKMLPENGGDINSRDGEGSTILFRAAKSDHLRLMEFFLSHDGNIEARDETGRTALHMAARQGWPGIQSLLSIGATADTQDDAGSSPLSEALLRNRHQSIIESLLQHRRPRVLNSSELDSLHRFVEQTWGWVHPIFKSLIDKDVKIKDTELFTKAFLLAVKRRLHVDIAFFLNAGVVDLEARNREGKTALQIAVASRSVDIVNLLVKRGADIAAVNIGSRTPIHDEVRRRCELDTVRVLLELGVHINARDSQGERAIDAALEVAERCKKCEEVRDVYMENESEVRRLDRRYYCHQHFEMLQLLQGHAKGALPPPAAPDPQPTPVVSQGSKAASRHITTLPTTHLSFARQMGMDF